MNTSGCIDVVSKIPRGHTPHSEWYLQPQLRPLSHHEAIPGRPSTFSYPRTSVPAVASTRNALPLLHTTRVLSSFGFHLKCHLQQEAIWIAVIQAGAPVSLSCSTVLISFLELTMVSTILLNRLCVLSVFPIEWKGRTMSVSFSWYVKQCPAHSRSSIKMCQMT